MKSLFICALLPVLSLGLISCDSTTSPENPLSEAPSIESFEVSPSEFNFTLQDDGFKDTTVTVEINSLISNPSDEQIPRYTISSKSDGEIVSEGALTPQDSRRFNFSTLAPLTTSTTSIEDFVVNVFFEEEPAVYAQTGFIVNGFANDPPAILQVNNPEEVTIPSGDETTDVFFTAKVTDPDGQNNIDRVLIEFLNDDGTKLVPDPNELLDDGRSGPNGSGDQVAGDSVYTIAFTITSGNTPNQRTAQYFAIDKAGLSSDTVETTFNIVE